jgi:hypothetical protein
MALQSLLFRDEPKLQACAEHDAAHVTAGQHGEHVRRIQRALEILVPDLTLPASEKNAGRYGTATANAVLKYKREHRPPIINPKYQSQPDSVVGRMTIAALDQDLLAGGPSPTPGTRTCSPPSTSSPWVNCGEASPQPPLFKQETLSTCWAYALFSWLQARKQQLEPRFRTPRDVVNFFMFEDEPDAQGRLRRKLNPSTKINYLYDNESLREVNVKDVIWRLAPGARFQYRTGEELFVLGQGGFLSGLLQSAGHVLVLNLESASWKHAYVVYRSCLENSPTHPRNVYWEFMDPASGTYTDGFVLERKTSKYALVTV